MLGIRDRRLHDHYGPTNDDNYVIQWGGGGETSFWEVGDDTSLKAGLPIFLGTNEIFMILYM